MWKFLSHAKYFETNDQLKSAEDEYPFLEALVKTTHIFRIGKVLTIVQSEIVRDAEHISLNKITSS